MAKTGGWGKTGDPPMVPGWSLLGGVVRGSEQGNTAGSVDTGWLMEANSSEV